MALDSNWEFSVSLPFGNDHEADFFAMFVLDSSYLDTNVPATNGAHNLPQVMRDDALAFNMVRTKAISFALLLLLSLTQTMNPQGAPWTTSPGVV